MSAIFLSASVPVLGRGDYYKTADPYLIQKAIRELIIYINGRYQIVWGGHPAITPMIWAICNDIDINYSTAFALYQSRYFEELFPEENKKFNNVTYIDAVNNDMNASLLKMREAMLSRDDLIGSVYIGGMEGMQEEYNIFKKYHPSKAVLPVRQTGGMALELEESMNLSAVREHMSLIELFANYLVDPE